MSQKSSIEIQADRVSKTACPKCGSVVDAAGAPPFSIVQCAKCHVKFAAPGKLGGFILLKELGRGQMGVTYKAFEKVLGRYVAIKVMRASLGSDPKRVKDFMAEGRALASLDHPNAVRIFSIGQEKGQPYIVMELVNGKSVGHVMGKDGKLSEPRALEIATGVARALRAASEIGLIHSDVKPDNIVLDEKGRAKLVDFGIARFGPGKLEADAAIGTPYYVAPEQVLRASVDHRTDIYSLGVTLFHSLAGVPPFPGTELKTVLHARLKKPAPSVMKVCRGLHLETVQVVGKMLEKDPEQRYQDYDELLKDLRKACWAAGAELTQDADDIPIGVAAPVSEKSSMGMVVFVLMLLLCAAGVGAWAMFFRGNGQPPAGLDPGGAPPPGQVASPVFSPRARKISGPIDVRVSCDTLEADIRYTTDGAVPTLQSTRWIGAIKIMPGMTVSARAFRKDMKPSEIVESLYKRDSVVLTDVVQIRSEADAAWKSAQGYELGQGFEAKIEQCKKLYDQAGELYRKEAYAAAKTPYKRVVFLCKELKRLDGTRKTAKVARDRARAAIKSAPDFGTVDKPGGAWKAVAETARKARATFDRGEFVKAYGMWGKVVGEIEQRYKAMLPAARTDYENALKPHDPKLLKDHGGRAWQAVELAAKQASQAGTAGRFAEAVTLYRKAKALLGPAVQGAKTASSGAKAKAAIASVKGLIAKGLYYKARTELNPILKASPKDPVLGKLKATIDAAVEIKIYLKPGASPEKGGLLMPLRRIEPGRFPMGSAKGESGRDNNETLHDVEITQAFYIGKYEVTRRQFEHFAKTAKYKTAPETQKKIWSTALVRGKLVKVAGASWKNPGFAQGPDHPVVCVSWEDAMAFCKWLSGRSAGMTITLPTEAQWEYACRQETQTRFSFGDDATKLHQYGNYADGSSAFASGDVRHSDGNAATSSVGKFKTTHKYAHLYDMHGNAAEWCSDWFGPYAGGSNGKAVKDPTGILRGAQRVVRGGSWASAPSKCRSAARGRMAGVAHSAIIGFRVVAVGKAPTAVATANATKAAVARRNAAKALKGRIGLGTWETCAEFKDLKVIRDGKELFTVKNFRQQKRSMSGKWAFGGNLMRQEDLGRDRFVTFGNPNWSDYALHVKARKKSGKEGFLIRVADNGKGGFYHFNLGGKGNTKHIIEKRTGHTRTKFLVESDGKIDNNKWYDIRVELSGGVIRGYLDNKLIHTLDVATGSSKPIPRNPTPSVAGTDLLPDFSKKFTITAWVRTKKNGTIFAKTAPMGKRVRGGKSLFVMGNGHVRYEIGQGGVVSGRTKIADGNWHHVALVGDGRLHVLYFDGRNDGQGNLNNLPDPEGSVGKIGFTATDFPNPSGFNGHLDEVCVYDRALSPAEVTASLTKPQNGLVGRWEFERGGHDSSIKGNHAVKITGARFVRGKVGKAVEFIGKGAMILARGK
ncbi:MAG: SUMF1/EgtB/PvdO family nonheme iron enzyme [Phycisphaerae bacterium]|jgi:formylglycine-generating enzyme required for sulfatase activity/ribosomal protein L37AE/L43A|nr:SUMF1/EgtB/PvdO family nonheme iron enzyme [Phycisphaerae bacterium]